MPKRNKPHARARDRAIRAVEMRLGGHTHTQISAALNYSSESGARMAIDRELNRRTVTGVESARCGYAPPQAGIPVDRRILLPRPC
jgi:hypothetical protein